MPILLCIIMLNALEVPSKIEMDSEMGTGKVLNFCLNFASTANVTNGKYSSIQGLSVCFSCSQLGRSLEVAKLPQFRRMKFLQFVTLC